MPWTTVGIPYLGREGPGQVHRATSIKVRSRAKYKKVWERVKKYPEL